MIILKAVAHVDSALVHHFLWRSYWVFTPSVFIVDEVKNFVANNFFKLVELVIYWDPCSIG